MAAEQSPRRKAPGRRRANSDEPRDNRTYRLDAGYANCADEVDSPWPRPEDVFLVLPGPDLDAWLAENPVQ